MAVNTHGRIELGVTLLELLVVTALASVALALVFPSVGAGISGLELQSAARNVAAAVRFAREQAVYRQRPYHLEIRRAEKTIAVTDAQGNERREFALPDAVALAEIAPAESASGTAGADSDTRRFIFYPNGAVPRIEVSLNSANRVLRIVSDPLTGSAKVEDQGL